MHSATSTELLEQLQMRCGYHFKDSHLLRQALTHPSYAAEQNPPPADNQRLEFLGDSVLQLILSELLFTSLPNEQEGTLTRLRSSLANEPATAAYAKKLGLQQAMLLGKGEEQSGGRKRRSILGDLFEAFLAAVYLDGGMDAARAICLPLLPPLDTDKRQLLVRDNPKGALQEFCQNRFKCRPKYEVISVEGPVHDPHFVVKVSINNVIMGQGDGSNHRIAERQAASQALQKIAEQDDAAQDEARQQPSPSSSSASVDTATER
jgi:ribonuclease-3